jgi:hypothetical protein
MPDFILPKFLKRFVFATLPHDGQYVGLNMLRVHAMDRAKNIGKGLREDSDINCVQILSVESSILSIFASVLASHCQPKWLSGMIPYLCIESRCVPDILRKPTFEGSDARFRFFTSVIPHNSSADCIVLVLDEPLRKTLVSELQMLTGGCLEIQCL